MLGLDSSFQGSRTAKPSSLMHISSNVSPRSNKQLQAKAASNSKTKSIERTAKPNQATKKASGAQTPIKSSTATSKGSVSPINVKPQTRAMNKSPSKSALSVQASSSSNLQTNNDLPDLQRRVSDNFDHSIEIQAKSISDVTDRPEYRNEQRAGQVSPLRSNVKPIGSELDILSTKNGVDTPVCGQVSKKNKNDNNTLLVMQNVYAIKAKPLNLTTSLRSISRTKTREEDPNRSKLNVVGSVVGMKDNDLKQIAGVRQSYEEAKSITVRKNASDPPLDKDKEKNFEVKRICSTGGWTLITSTFPGENTANQEELNTGKGQLNVNIESPLLRVVYSSKNGNQSPSSLKKQVEEFVDKLDGVVHGIQMKEKRSVFIKLLQMLHKQKILLSKFLRTQEYNKMAMCFYSWLYEIKSSKTASPVRKNKSPEAMEEVNLSIAINFHNQKLYSKYFYQGFLGHYALCKLGNNQDESSSLVLDSRKSSMSSVRRSVPNITLLQPVRKTPADNATKSPLRPRTPLQTSTRDMPKQSVRENTTKRGTTPLRSPYGDYSPNQSFTTAFEKNSKKDAQVSQRSPVKTPQRITKTPSNKMNKSFEQKNPRPIDGKRSSISEATAVSTWQANKGVCETENMAQEQIKNTPRPIKKKGSTTPAESSRVTYSDKAYRSVTQISARKEDTLNKSMNAGSTQQGKDAKGLEKRIQDRQEVTKVIKKRSEIKKDTISFRDLQKTKIEKTKSPTLNKSTIAKKNTATLTDLEKEEANMKKAVDFNNRRILRKYGDKFITTLIELVNRKLEAAWYLRIRNLLKRGFTGLSTGRITPEKTESDNGYIYHDELEDSEEEDDVQMVRKLKIAQEHYETNIKINVYNALLENYIQSHQENDFYAKHRERYMLKTCFRNWSQAISEPNEDSESDEEGDSPYDGIVEQFRFIMLAEKAMRQLRANVASSAQKQK